MTRKNFIKKKERKLKIEKRKKKKNLDKREKWQQLNKKNIQMYAIYDTLRFVLKVDIEVS